MSRPTVVVQWTDTAKECLERLPLKVRKGLLEKADELLTATDPTAHKPLTGPLQGYYGSTYSRYRAIYSVDEETLPAGRRVIRILIRFVAAGIRKEGDKTDVYALALKLLGMGRVPTRRPKKSRER